MWKIARIQGPKFFFFFVQIAVVIVIILFNPCGIFEKMTSFTPVFNLPRIGTRKIYGGAKFSEIKVQKTTVVMFVID